MYSIQYTFVLWVVLPYLLFTDNVVGTKCYVCGGNWSTAIKCIDDYVTDYRDNDIIDCGETKTSGCIKSKYVDKNKEQIVTRSCAPEVGMRHQTNECKSTEVDNHSVFFCHCSGDFCNTSANHGPSYTLVIIYTALVVIATSLVNFV